jgi:uncharacterized membrane protein (UPF0127 family)
VRAPLHRALLLLAFLAAPAAAQTPEPTEHVLVLTTTGPVELRLELADEPEERTVGLMFRQSLAERTGMLFDFGAEEPVAMWMRNTLIPLDMLFVSEGGRIVHIAAMTVPHSLDTITAGVPVRGVIEIAGGEAARLGIAPGDLVVRPLFGR